MAELTFTGERFLPGCAGEIAYEHWHRYAFARRFAAGKRVLDVACGEGYGTSMLGAAAASVIGVDIDGATVAHALARYGNGGRTQFVEGSCASLPLPDASFDVIVSFETVEHLDASDQPRMIAEFDRVLAPDGILVISSPNKRLYSDARNYSNEFHRHELYRDEFAHLLQRSFPAQQWHHQRLATWSGIWAEEPGPATEAWLGDADGVEEYIASEGMYFVVVAARLRRSLPPATLRASLFTDADDSVGKRAEENAREVLRLDARLKESNLGLERQERLIDELHIAISPVLLGAVSGYSRIGHAVAALDGEVSPTARSWREKWRSAIGKVSAGG
jgi:SAM-dependent methyltransferase